MPWNGPVPLPGSIVAASWTPIADRSLGAICASTQTCDRLATVKAGDEPAWSSWPGVTVLSTMTPETGARMTPARPAVGFPTWRGDGAAVDAHRQQRLQRGDAVGFGACGIGLRLRGLALGDAVVRGKVAVGARDPPRVGRGDRGLAISRRPQWRNRRTATSASGWPLATGWPSATKMRVTGPVNGETTEVAWSLSKSTVPGASIFCR